MISKSQRRLLSLVGACSCLLAFTSGAGAQCWMPVNTSSNFWQCVAASADGTRLIAGQQYSGVLGSGFERYQAGSLYLSIDSGRTWTETTAPRQQWFAVASSTNGSNLVAASYLDANRQMGGIYVSTNAGIDWTKTSATISNWGQFVGWVSLACSADGSSIFATVWGGHIYASTDFGATWTRTSAPHKYWKGIACSADGTKVLAAGFLRTSVNPNSQAVLHLSSNSGRDWTPVDVPISGWWSVTVSADGSRMAAAAESGLLYVSFDAGANWQAADVPAESWRGLASSADGTRLVAVASSDLPGGTYVSDDSGLTWRASAVPPRYWAGVASAADGTRVAAVEGGYQSGHIYRRAGPTLSIRLEQDVIILEWPFDEASSVLQQKSSISEDWIDVFDPFFVVNGMNQFLIFPSATSQFFRVRSDCFDP